MHANVIDTLHFANGLKASGFPADQAEGLAQALNDELASQMITPTILRDELRPIGEHLGRLDAHVVRLDGKIDALGKRLDEKIDAQGERLDEKIDALGERLDEKIDALGARLDGKIDMVESKLETRIGAVESKLSILTGTMALGFTLLIALGLYNVMSREGQESAQPTQAAVAPQKAPRRTTMPAL